jgi:hypothetical protein
MSKSAVFLLLFASRKLLEDSESIRVYSIPSGAISDVELLLTRSDSDESSSLFSEPSSEPSSELSFADLCSEPDEFSEPLDYT